MLQLEEYAQNWQHSDLRTGGCQDQHWSVRLEAYEITSNAD